MKRLIDEITRRLAPALIALMAAALWSGAAQAAPAPAAVRAYVAGQDFNGSIVVRRGGRTLYSGAFGLANRPFGVPARADTRYAVASITKVFTAVLILQLRGEGRLDLNAPVSAYLPRYAANGAQAVTIAQLLNHTSGLPNTNTVESYDEAARDGMPIFQTPMTSDQLVARYASGPLARPPGQAFDYNNGDYFVLGKVIEALTGLTYEQALQARILRPLGLRNTGLLSHDRIVPGLADTYYQPDAKGGYVNDLPVFIENLYAAGAMYSTAADLAAFTEALHGGRLIKPPSLALMLTPGLDDYGYGLWIRGLKVDGKRHPVSERYGSMMGANGIVFRVLDADLTVVILANTNAPALGDLAADIAMEAMLRKAT